MFNLFIMFFSVYTLKMGIRGICFMFILPSCYLFGVTCWIFRSCCCISVQRNNIR